MAEREGFEPPMGLHPCRISSAVHSTTLPPLRKWVDAAARSSRAHNMKAGAPTSAPGAESPSGTDFSNKLQE
jgi:hypothetical protein